MQGPECQQLELDHELEGLSVVPEDGENVLNGLNASSRSGIAGYRVYSASDW